MTIAVAADHAGFPLKAAILQLVQELGHEPLDLGTHSTEPVDYPDYAEKMARAITEKRADRGVLLCGSGAGICIAANKFRGIRAATCHDTFSAHQAVEDDAANTLCIGARIVGPSLAVELVRTFLNAQFSGAARHVRRLEKVKRFEADFITQEH
ncbi:MAG: ribose 5-phosphate isomerase B [Acidobacteriota bacterium]|nr:ribose 5-phosphate isomerase B [Acidobacteriota bacterium]